MAETFEDLTTFLKVQIHTDATLAREALAGWKDGPEGDEMAGAVDSVLIGGHLVRWSPHRVLVECEAKRFRVDLHRERLVTINDYEMHAPNTSACRECSYDADSMGADEYTPYPCPTLRAEALPYADREGYRPEWAVDGA